MHLQPERKDVEIFYGQLSKHHDHKTQLIFNMARDAHATERDGKKTSDRKGGNRGRGVGGRQLQLQLSGKFCARPAGTGSAAQGKMRRSRN